MKLNRDKINLSCNYYFDSLCPSDSLKLSLIEMTGPIFLGLYGLPKNSCGVPAARTRP